MNIIEMMKRSYGEHHKFSKLPMIFAQLKVLKKEYKELLDIECKFKENPKDKSPIEFYYTNTQELRY